MTILDENLIKLEKFLKPFKDKGVLNNINGLSKPASSGKTFKNISPVDDSFICNAPRSNFDDIDEAAKASYAAFK